ncbi:MAG: ABC transporter permease [Lachnospiraceae bacterium]|nr:ABC transporter permease [Lachnospiraceae bacterium]MBQ9563431.1 ABC transporter permease [Lachnospiraceae bacterium]MBR0152351.1 ABC transporter permease [Lachnospiraceae bacterium]
MKKEKTYRALSIAVLALVLIFALIGWIHTPYDPDLMDGSAKYLAPCLAHPFGTDKFGRDIFSRIAVGCGTTALISVAVIAIGAFFGTILGAFSGYIGGVFDRVMMRVSDIIASFPSIFLALVFVGIIGPGTLNLILALGIVFIPTFARVVRSEFVVQKELEYVKHARLMGAGILRIVFVHILPNCKRSFLSTLTIAFNSAVLAEAGMSFLGLGVQPPTASLGRMLSEAQPQLMRAPWIAIFPGLFILFTVLGFGLLAASFSERR